MHECAFSILSFAICPAQNFPLHYPLPKKNSKFQDFLALFAIFVSAWLSTPCSFFACHPTSSSGLRYLLYTICNPFTITVWRFPYAYWTDDFTSSTSCSSFYSLQHVWAFWTACKLPPPSHPNLANVPLVSHLHHLLPLFAATADTHSCLAHQELTLLLISLISSRNPDNLFLSALQR